MHGMDGLGLGSQLVRLGTLGMAQTVRWAFR